MRSDDKAGSIIVNPFTVDIDKLEGQKIDEGLLKYTFKDEKAINNLAYIMKDILSGDVSLARREEYAYLNFKQLQEAIKFLLSTGIDDSLRQLLLERPYLLTFKDKPPTAEEFLGEKYIGVMSESVWVPVKKAFIEYLDPLKPYRTAALNPSIGAGKSTFTMLVLLYVAVCFALMRDPWKFFSMSPTSVFVFVLCAVTQSKASEIYLEPIQQLIESATYWKFCRDHQAMIREDNHLRQSDYVNYIPWTTSSKTSVLQTGNGLNWKQISSAGSLLGMNILVGAMTEITFFLEAGKGWNGEKLMGFFSKLRQRISNRFQNNYYARFILDSSPSSLEDPIQSWMTYDAPNNSANFVWKGSRWNLYPEEFPDFCNIEDLHGLNEKITENHNFDVGFKLFKGGNGKIPQICETDSEAAIFEEADTIWCPIKQVTKKGTENFLDKAKENPIEFMKNIAGIPAGQADRIFYQGHWIDDCFDNGLKNVYGSIVALAHEEPEHLIWNQIYNLFFNKILDRWYYYYEPDLPRVISVDLSKSKDCTCIAMSHVERDPTRIDPLTGQSVIVYVTDFTIMLVPKGGLINLDAVKFFILDLRKLGGLNIRHVSFDGYQSESTKQALKRMNFTVDYISVDSNNESYYTYIDLVTKNRWFCGKNIFVKNNMKSLYHTKRKRSESMKIEHFPGDLNYDWQGGDWITCTAGINAKDATDAIAGNIELMKMYSGEFIPSKIWNPQACFDRDYDNVFQKNKDFLKSVNLRY